MSNVINNKGFNTMNDSSFNSKKMFGFMVLAAIVVLFLVPNLAFATDADDSIKEGVAFAVKMLRLIIYGLMGITFIVMVVLLLKALIAWKDENNREGTVGGILSVVFVGLGVMGIIFLLGERALLYFDTNLVVSELAPSVISLLTVVA